MKGWFMKNICCWLEAPTLQGMPLARRLGGSAIDLPSSGFGVEISNVDRGLRGVRGPPSERLKYAHVSRSRRTKFAAIIMTAKMVVSLWRTSS